MSLFKIPFLLLDSIEMKVNATPPNPPSPLEEHIVPDWRERFLKRLAIPCRFLRALYWAVEMIEILVILSNRFPSSPISHHILRTFVFNGIAPSHIRVTPLFLLGSLLGVFGTILRVKCYRTLGRLFTFELCIRKDHELIVSGPYAVIRHPSYTALILSIVGSLCNHASGSWLRECGVLDTGLGRVLLLVWLAIASAVVASLLLRVPIEDTLLQNAFPHEWSIWARKVPYKLVPGVY